MGFEEILKKEEVSVEDLQRFQEEYDQRFVDQKFTGFPKVRHTNLHLAKLLGKLSDYCEKSEHGEGVSPQKIREEVIPDLLVYALWLSREFGVKPDESYFKRMVWNMERLYGEKISSDELRILKDLLNEREK